MERLGGAVRGELSRLGPMAAMGDLARAWPGVVGDLIARNAWPARVTRDGTLIVYTRDSVWAYELGQREAEIRDRLGELVSGTLRFIPGPLPEPALDEDAIAKPPPPAPSPEALAEAERLAAEIGDEELRERVVRAAAASLEAARYDRGVW